MSEQAIARHTDSGTAAPPAARLTRSRGNDMKRLLHAAEKGDAGSQFNLAVLYGNGLDDNGRVAPGNRAEAVKWLQRAAVQELPRAQQKLAELYAEAPGAPANRIRACAWFLRAIANSGGMHRHAAQAAHERMLAQMTPAEIATANRLARIWKYRIDASAARARSGLLVRRRAR